MAYAGPLVMLTLLCSVSGYPFNVNVTEIKSTSARLHWKSTELVVEEFLIQCVGTQFYAVARDGRVHNTEMHVRSQFVPKGLLAGVRIGDLRPNYNYTCVIQETLPEDAQVVNGILSAPIAFTTDYADPAPPKSPVIVKEGGITRVNIFKSPSDKFGPIDGYKVQFHVIESSFLGDVAVVDREFTDPFGKFSPSTIEYAQTAQRALSFQISYTGSNIPSFVQIDSDLLRGGLKNGYLYRVVTVAYTKRKDATVAFTPSRPSDSFMAVGVDKYISQGRFLSDMQTQQLKIGIAAGVLIPLICLIYMCFVGILLLCREKQQAAVYKREYRRSGPPGARKAAENIKYMLLACGMGCFTRCMKCWRFFCLCGWDSKHDPRGGASYQRLESQRYKQAEEAKSFTQLEPPACQSSSDEVHMYDKAPSMRTKSPSPVPLPQPSRENLLAPKAHRPHRHKTQVQSQYKHQSHTTSRQPSTSRQATAVMSRKIRMPTHLAFSRSHHLSHIPSRSHHRTRHISSNKLHSSHRLPHRSIPHHHHHHSGARHSSRLLLPTGYENQLVPKYSYLTNLSRHPLSVQRTPLTSPRNQRTVSHRSHRASPHRSFQKQSHHKAHVGPVPWTTITVPTYSTAEELKRHSRPPTPISSPKFEQTSGTQPLRYTTSATGAFNTAEEFYSPNNSVGGMHGKSSDLFLPRAIHSGTSNMSLSVSQQQISLRLPGNGNGYELISLSSSMIGNESEPTPMEAIQ